MRASESTDPVNAAFLGLAFTAALNPKPLGADLLIIQNRRPRAISRAAAEPAAGGPHRDARPVAHPGPEDPPGQ
jgi:hypothetical protein